MILIDTNIWADHIAKPIPLMNELVETEEVCSHPHVIGELALGNLRQFDLVIRFLKNLRQVKLAEEDEVLHLIKSHRLSGTGIGYTDAHLLASLLLETNARLWTRDKRLGAVAQRFGFAYSP
ncbi:PIN domain-containing protein [Pseudorhizobium endolithicum]|uniref:PIN domain-containing protein n=1 Tax=Pseudorhizobium endolithicum TaxID=1191678 RepID=A0ABN7JEI6_9HYPH|nr:type II toxin-antitoxin system VapC family toxin [Pseudorhizobium endolithicum]CAD6420732.1 PIN domain-containing protein [Rhizobium sp. Q54]CAD7026949.1 PIN domain-containing protein [Pseudorhizobium endolithicum]